MLTAALVLGSHAMHDSFAVISWNAAGIDTATASLIWSESVAAEVVMFFLLGPALIERLGPGTKPPLSRRRPACCAGSVLGGEHEYRRAGAG